MIQPPGPSPQSRFRLFVFDLDGTLIDSRRDLAASVNAMLVEYNVKPLPEDEVGLMVGDGAAVLVARALTAAGIEPSPAALQRFLAIYNDRLTESTRPYPGIPAALYGLASRAALAVLTNKPIAPTRTILDRLRLAPYFPSASVIGGDGPFPRKPDPAGLRHLAETAGVGLDETLMVGDSIIDWRTAAGAPTTMCVARWGFGFQSIASLERSAQPASPSPLADAIVVVSPNDLLEL